MSFFTICGILFPFVMTTLGAAMVFLLKNKIGPGTQRVCLGFASGVMAAATAFSLLVPASGMMGKETAWMILPPSFLLGAGAVMAFDVFLCRARCTQRQGADAQKRLMLFAAITLHNIPEGMAVGLAFAAAGANPAAAAAVALGIGLQNLPEGAAAALPMRQGGLSRKKSFLLGMLSGAVEPAAAVLMIAFSAMLAPVLPALMAFSAGAMMVVVLCELAPASAAARDGGAAAMLGFALMMAMDLGLS